MKHHQNQYLLPALGHTRSLNWSSACWAVALACGLAGHAQSEEIPALEPAVTAVTAVPTELPLHHAAPESQAAPEMCLAEILPAPVPTEEGAVVAAEVAGKPEPGAQTGVKRALGESIARGLASWYGPRFHGRRTANGERYDMSALTAAHKTLPFGTKVRVRSVHTGKEIVVRINDRGPYKHLRIIDLSQAAMAALGVLHRGVSEVILLRE